MERLRGRGSKASRSVFGILAAAAFAVSACNSVEKPLSVSPNHLLDELVDEPASAPKYFTPVIREKLLSSLAEADLLSMGESLDSGLERDYLAQLYADLSSTLGGIPAACLVENGGPGSDADDPVSSPFSRICPEGRVLHPAEEGNYAQDLWIYLSQGQVLTHTDNRRILPLGLIYPRDFDHPEWVDLPEHGTITKQVPEEFLKAKKKMRAHVVLSLEELLFPELLGQMSGALKAAVPPDQVAFGARSKLTQLMNSPSLQFGPGEVARIFEVRRVEDSFEFEKAFLSLIENPEFDTHRLSRVLASAELRQLLELVDPSTLEGGVFLPGRGKQALRIGTIEVSEPGTIYFFGTSGKKGRKLVVVTITPTQEPVLTVSDRRWRSHSISVE